jgi:hypothetical protein
MTCQYIYNVASIIYAIKYNNTKLYSAWDEALKLSIKPVFLNCYAYY